ncbi:MAG: hypothetical protein IRZ04_08225 [Rhodospirillales bacterium]|nr:hypothetical protein [Rhodospirillales bacterium]
MAMRRFLDNVDGAAEFLLYDEAEDRFAVESVADITPVIERNKALFTADDGGWSPTREWRRVASFPPIVIEIFKRRWGADPLARGNEALLRRLLNEPELRHFRTAPGSI